MTRQTSRHHKKTEKIPLTVALMTHNRENYLKETIEAILLQTYKDFELLILDNGSTDQTPSIVLGIKDVRLRYIRNPSGFCAYFNGISALKIARGNRIIMTHDDDIMEPDLLAKEMKIMDENPDIIAVWSNVSVIDKNGKLIRSHLTPPGKNRIFKKGEFITQLAKEFIWPPPSTLMFERQKFPPNTIRRWYYHKTLGKSPPKTHGGDDVLIPSYMNTLGSVAFLNEPLLRYRKHEQQDTHKIETSLPILNTYKALLNHAKKLPNKEEITPILNSHVIRFSTQREITKAKKKNISKGIKNKIKKSINNILTSDNQTTEATLPIQPLIILLSQIEKGNTEIFRNQLRPEAWRPTSYQAFFYWIKLREAGKNLLTQIPYQSQIVILGSSLVSALLINEARETNLNVLCYIDSNITRQHQTMLGIPIHPPEWLASQGKAVDYVILSSERDQDAYLHEFIHGLNKDVTTLSWKDLALDQRHWMNAPPGPSVANACSDRI